MRRHLIGSLVMAGLVVAMSSAATAVRAQDLDPQQLFDAGRYADALQAIGEDNGDDMRYLAAQAHLRLQQNAEARAKLAQMGGGDEANPWTFIGRSAAAQIDGNAAEAESNARRAAEVSPGLPDAHYQLGQALFAASKWAPAAEAFAQAGKLAPTHAYAHYYAGQAYYRAKRVDRMAQHFEYFLKLAPQAPERPQVEAVMRTVRG